MRSWVAGFICCFVVLTACSGGSGISGTYTQTDVSGTMTLQLNRDNSFAVTLGSSKLSGEYRLEGGKITLRVQEIEGRAKRMSDDKPITGKFDATKSNLTLDVNGVQVRMTRK